MGRHYKDILEARKTMWQHMLHQTSAPLSISTCGEVWSRDALHELFDCDVRLVYKGVQPGHDLPQVVRGDACCNPDGDALGTVDEQVGHPGGQHAGLLLEHRSNTIDV